MFPIILWTLGSFSHAYLYKIRKNNVSVSNNCLNIVASLNWKIWGMLALDLILKYDFILTQGGLQTIFKSPLSTLAWKIPRTGEPGRLQSMGSLRVGHD